MGQPVETFGKGRKFFHWAIAAFLLFQIPFAWYMVDLPLAEKASPYNLHKSLGMVLFALGIGRLIWALFTPRPALDEPWPAKAFAKVLQAILYIIVCLMPVSGWIMSSAAGLPPKLFGLVQLPAIWATDPDAVEGFRRMHELQSWILLGALSLHFLGAMRHHFILKNDVLRRMLPGK